MNKFFGKIKNFFIELRKKPENIRQRWLWIFVIVSMSLVLVFWILFFDNNFQTVSQNSVPTPSPIVKEEGTGSLYIFKIGFQKSANFIVQKVARAGEAIGNVLAGGFSLVFQGWKKIGKVFAQADDFLESQFVAYFKSIASLWASEI